MNQMRESIKPMTDDDYKKLMSDVGMSDSKSLLAALKQVANHTAQYTLQQAAQSVSVPVAGDVVAWRWIRVSTGEPDGGRFFDGVPSDSAIKTAANSYIPCAPQLLIVQPATSIRADEIDALRKESELLTWLLKDAELVHQGRGVNHWQIGGIVFDGAGEIDLGDKQLEMRAAIVAAIAGEKNHG